MAYEISVDSAVVTSERLTADDELVIRDIAQRWVEYCVLPVEVRDQFAEWGNSVVQDASKLSDEGILRVYAMMEQLTPDVHADAQARFNAHRKELARQAEADAARAAEQRLGNTPWRFAAKLLSAQD